MFKNNRMSNLRTPEILAGIKKMKYRVQVVGFLMNSETFGLMQSAEMIFNAIPNLNEIDSFTLADEFFNRNPIKLNKVYADAIK